MNRKVKAIHTCLLIYGGTGKGRGKEMLAQPKAGLHWQGCRQGETQNGKYNSETVCYIQQFHLCGFVSSFNAKKVVTLSWKFKLSCTLGYLSIWRTFCIQAGFLSQNSFVIKKSKLDALGTWMYQFGDASGSLCIHSCPPQGCFPSWGGFQTKLQLLTLPSASQNCWSFEKCSQTSLLLGSAIKTEGEHTLHKLQVLCQEEIQCSFPAGIAGHPHLPEQIPWTGQTFHIWAPSVPLGAKITFQVGYSLIDTEDTFF